MILKWVLPLFFAVPAFAQVEHELIRRLVVFPVLADKQLEKAAEDTWWQIREILTENKRFLVASKNFLVNKDVFQPRGALEPADVIILGRLLDAHVIVTSFIEDRKLKMKVYEVKFGRTIWEQSINLHPSIPLAEQVTGAGKKLIFDFIASIPYQGFVVVDDLIGRPVYVDGERTLVKVNIGINSQIEPGDTIQLIKVTSSSLKPLLGEDSKVDVFAEGRVIRVNRNLLTVELIRLTSVDDIKKYSLVRVPREFKRLREMFALQESPTKNIDPSFMNYKEVQLSEEQKEWKPLVSSVGFIANIALFLILAF